MVNDIHIVWDIVVYGCKDIYQQFMKYKLRYDGMSNFNKVHSCAVNVSGTVKLFSCAALCTFD